MKPRATRFSTGPAPSPSAIITGSALDKTAPEPCRQAPLDDMMDLYDDTDRGVYRRVSDTLLRDRWGAELARRVRALATYEGGMPNRIPRHGLRNGRQQDRLIHCVLHSPSRKPSAAVSCSCHAMLTRDGVRSGPTPHRTSA